MNFLNPCTRARLSRRLAPLLLLACAASVLPTVTASAETVAVDSDPLATLVAAQAAYDTGISLLRSDPTQARRHFAESAALFAAVRDGGADNASLHFNLGNAQLQAQHIGPAIASFLRAERSSPGDTRVQQNLAHARTLVTDRFERAGATTLIDSVASWWHVLSLSTRARVAIVAWTALWILVIIRLLTPRLFASEGASLGFRLAAGATAITAVVVGATVITDVSLDRLRPRGVISESGVIVRKGNGDGFEPQFQESLGEGVEFRVLDRRPGWVQIELPNGRNGWIRESEADLV